MRLPNVTVAAALAITSVPLAVPVLRFGPRSDERLRLDAQRVGHARSLGQRVTLLASPSWISDTPRLENAFNVPFGVSVLVAPDARFEVEYVPKNGDLDDSVAAWHAGFSKTVGGHLFKVFLGNSRATTVDQMIGGDSDAAFRSSDLRLGFNLIRYLPR